MGRFGSIAGSRIPSKFRFRLPKGVEHLEKRTLRSGSDDRLHVLAALVPHAEVHTLAKSKKPPVNPQDVQFVRKLFVDLVGKPPKTADLNKITAQLAKTHSRDQAVGMVLANAAYPTSVVNGLYLSILGRKPKGKELPTATKILKRGSARAIAASLYGSTDFTRKVGTAGDAFVAAVSQRELGQSLDPDSAAPFIAQLAGGTSRTLVAAAIMDLPAARQAAVRSYYQKFLGRNPDSSESASGVDALAGGASPSSLFRSILTTDEFYTGIRKNIDEQPPAIALNGPAAGVTATNVVITGKVSDNIGVVALSARVDGGAPVGVTFDPGTGAFSLGTTFALDGSAEGKHFVEFTAADAQGNISSPVTFPLTLDTRGPNLTIGSPVAGSFVNSPPAVVGTALDGGSGIASMLAQVDAGAFAPLGVDGTGHYTVVTTGLGEGTHTVNLRATDGAGNTATATTSFTLDSKAPIVAIGSPAQNALLTTSPTIAGTVTEAGSGVVDVRYRIDAGDLVPAVLTGAGEFSIPTAIATDGAHTVTLRVTDRAGNIGTSTLNFTLDTNGPTVTIDAPTANTAVAAGAVVMGHVTDAGPGVSKLEARVDAGAFTTIAVGAGGAYSYPIGLASNGSADGAHSVTLRATDSAGNVQTQSVAFTLDTLAPSVTITAPTSGQTTGSNPIVAGSASDTGAGIATVKIKVDGGAFTAVAVDASGNFSTATTINSNGAHTVIVRAADKAGNTFDRSVTFTVLTVGPTLAVDSPTAGAVYNAAPIVTGNVTPKGSAVSKLEVAADAGAFANVTFDAGTGAFSVPSGVTGDGAHIVHLRATGQPGEVTTLDISFTIDTTPPPAPGLALKATDQVGGPLTTSAAIVTLVGATDPNATITLIETGATAQASGAGAFSFANVALNVGANTFTAKVTDAAGNASQKQTTITRSDVAASADPVLRWVDVTLKAIQSISTDPEFASRGMAMVSSAVYDAVSAIDGTPALYAKLTAPAGAVPAAAVAAAAHRVLSYLFPSQQSVLDADLAADLAAIPDGKGKTDGVALGRAAGDAIVTLRDADGWNSYVDENGSTNVGKWRPTGPMFATAENPQWATLQPFVMTSADQFRAPAPPTIGSQAWVDAFNQVKDLGSATSATRTAEQTQIARFWADGGGSYTPPGHWEFIASQVAAQKGNSLSQNARLFAQLNIAMADGAVAAWSTKYYYDTWRPITAISNADLLGN